MRYGRREFLRSFAERKRLRRRAQAVCVVFLFFLSSCTSKQGQDFAATNADQIRVGVTNKATVQSLLGPPLNTNIKGPDETWAYSYSATDTSAVYGTTVGGLIPIVGPLVALGSMNSPITSDQKQISITFHNDIVQTCVVRLMATSGTMMNAQGGSTTREIACGQPVK
jgi:outer membrane protein assembly factor BamE (lipoprotein component of BamABCDE complex)